MKLNDAFNPPNTDALSPVITDLVNNALTLTLDEIDNLRYLTVRASRQLVDITELIVRLIGDSEKR